MSSQHPLAPEILPYCQKYPSQASSLFQSFIDLRLAQQWRDLEVLELDEISTVVLRGRPKTPAKASPAIVLPMNLTTPTSLQSLDSVLTAVAKLPASTAPETTPTSTDSSSSPTIYLAIVEKDSSIVYYVLKQGIVSPKEVPE
ncbi:Sen15p [Sporobolomyces salmoneus]|uniref:Sen15p n=1 Tax=Sporobolomyces salmoneus TaxID=183962 RepID=UPI00317B7BF9